MGRIPCCEKDSVKRGQWTPEEDAKLVTYISQHGTRNWRLLPKNAGLQRCGKSCRLRWTNYLRPDLKHGEFTEAEEQIIVKLHSILGNRWSLIGHHLPGRTDNDVKNHWNTKMKKKLSGMGIDPVTDKPFSHLMAEIASTLAPPQVAHLAEAALGCFKDEMLHLLTKKRIDWQHHPTHQHQDHNNSFSTNNANVLLQQNPNPNADVKIKQHGSHPQSMQSLNFCDLTSPSEFKDLSFVNGNTAFYSFQPSASCYHFSAGNGMKHHDMELEWTQNHHGQGVDGDGGSSSLNINIDDGDDDMNVNMELWKNKNEDGESHWGDGHGHSACNASASAYNPSKLKHKHHQSKKNNQRVGDNDKAEEEEEEDGDKGVSSVFNSDSVLWDLSDDLMNPLL